MKTQTIIIISVLLFSIASFFFCMDFRMNQNDHGIMFYLGWIFGIAFMLFAPLATFIEKRKSR